MGKKGDGDSSTAGRADIPQASGRLILTLQKIVITVKKDLIVTFILDGVEKISHVDKSLFEELNEVSWGGKLPTFRSCYHCPSKPIVHRNRLSIETDCNLTR